MANKIRCGLRPVATMRSVSKGATLATLILGYELAFSRFVAADSMGMALSVEGRERDWQSAYLPVFEALHWEWRLTSTCTGRIRSGGKPPLAVRSCEQFGLPGTASISGPLRSGGPPRGDD